MVGVALAHCNGLIYVFKSLLPFAKTTFRRAFYLQVGHGRGVAGAGALPRGGGEHGGERQGRAHPPPPSRRPGPPSNRTDTHLGKRQIEYIHVGSSVADL
jgi:hypothetical protein